MAKTILTLLSFAFFLLGPSALAQVELVVALKPDKNPDAMAAQQKELSAQLAKSLKRKVRVIVPMSGTVIQEGFRNGTVDIAFLSGMESIKAADVAELLLTTKVRGNSSYESYWIAKKGSGVKGVIGLKGKSVAFASRTSTSGYLVPVAAMIDRGLLKAKQDPSEFFGPVFFGTGYSSAVERVLSGQAVAAAVSDYVLLENKHLTQEQRDQLEVIDRQGPVPTHSLVVRSKLSKSEKDQLRSAFLELNRNPKMRDQMFTGELVPVDQEAHLSGLRSALEKTGIKL
jgi:phosphonate transport system substrate-binding protein